ncbi:MAG: CoA transferase, partial [Rhodobacteraceae bacterium]|nr:CoA transferase [Paracoccaceae bacterium]
HWAALARAMGAPHLASDPRYEGNIERTKRRAEVDAIVSTWTGAQTRSEIFAELNKANVPSAPVRQISEIARDKDMIRRGMIVEQPHPELGSVPVPTSPFRFSRHANTKPRCAPTAGEHTNEVLGRRPVSDITE